MNLLIIMRNTKNGWFPQQPKFMITINKSKLEKQFKQNLSNFKLSNSYGHRAVGDKIEDDCAKIAEKFYSKNYIKPMSKRSIEDFSLVDKTQHNLLDVKTHFIQTDKGFSMPNLISVKRLKKLLEKDTHSLLYIFVDYSRSNGNVIIEDVHIKYVWELDWSMLGIGALGKGQLQIKDANKELVFTTIGKNKWFKILKERVNEFYKKELIKIEKEIKLWK